MTLASFTDEDLAAAARDGDGRAFELLYARYRPRIKSLALRLTHDADRADDITQEVFISALRRLRESDQRIVFRPWIYEIARNACIDDYRRSSRKREIPIERDGDDGWLVGLPSSPPPHVAVESKQQLDHLCGAFRGLSERHHQIIVLRELEGLSYRQIGDRLGMSKIVVESTLFRARRRLTEEFEDLASGRRCEHVQQLLHRSPDHARSRFGLRERRAISRHLEHCVPCRREAVAAGFEFGRPRAVERAAALLPLPLIQLVRRGAGAARCTARAAHQSLLPGAPSVAGAADSVVALGSSGRFVATAATVVAAALGGGLLSGAGRGSSLAGAGPGRLGHALAADTRSSGSGYRPVGLRLASLGESRAVARVAGEQASSGHSGMARRADSRGSAGVSAGGAGAGGATTGGSDPGHGGTLITGAAPPPVTRVVGATGVSSASDGTTVSVASSLSSVTKTATGITKPVAAPSAPTVPSGGGITATLPAASGLPGGATGSGPTGSPSTTSAVSGAVSTLTGGRG